MVEIAYVCLSDLHMGMEKSLVSGGSVKAGLAQCLGTLAHASPSGDPRTAIVLAGDAVDLAMANVPACLYGLGELLFSFGSEKPGFRKVVYVPGNHDHHLWTLHRHGCGDLIPAFQEYEQTGKMEEFHSTLCRSQRFSLLEPVISYFKADPDKHLPTEQRTRLGTDRPDLRLSVEIACPNYAIPEHGDEGGDCKRVMFTHGNFIDQVYWMGSKLARFCRCGEWPKSPEAWDQQNGAWVDYVWSTMGSTGGAGQAAGLLYEAFLQRQPAAIRELLGRWFCPRKRWESERDASGKKIPSPVRGPIGQERYKTKKVLGRKQKKMVWKYAKEYLPNDLGEKVTHLGSDVTLVFGHTHKPHSWLGTAKKTGIAEGLRVYNTGGWVVDGHEAQSHYGADLVVFDERLNSAAIRLFRQVACSLDVYTVGPDGEPLYEVPRGHASYDLVNHLRQVIATEPWAELGKTIQKEVTRLLDSNR